jgi:hypothetical protein
MILDWIVMKTGSEFKASSSMKDPSYQEANAACCRLRAGG